jgi:hypothetical protein
VLHVRSRASEPMRDDAEPRSGHRRRPIRLLQALRRGRRRSGRVPAGAAGSVHAHQGARRRTRRTVRLSVRRATDRLAGRGVRRRARRRDAARAGPWPHRVDGLPHRVTPQELPGHRRRPR